jgi:hypothetical protein
MLVARGVFHPSDRILDELSFRQYADRFIDNRSNAIHEIHWPIPRPRSFL